METKEVLGIEDKIKILDAIYENAKKAIIEGSNLALISFIDNGDSYYEEAIYDSVDDSLIEIIFSLLDRR